MFERVELNIRSVTKGSVTTFRVVKGKDYLGVYPTIEEARRVRDGYHPPKLARVRHDGSPWTRENSRTVRLLVVTEIETHEVKRPETRADCAAGIRPCPWYSCRHHLGLDVIDEHGAIRYHDPERLDELTQTCALDVADNGSHTLEEVGSIYGVTRERIRQIEHWGLRGMVRGMGNLEEHLAEVMRTREGDDDGAE